MIHQHIDEILQALNSFTMTTRLLAMCICKFLARKKITVLGKSQGGIEGIPEESFQECMKVRQRRLRKSVSDSKGITSKNGFVVWIKIYLWEGGGGG